MERDELQLEGWDYEYDPIFTCERCEEEYDITADWDDECYCENCCEQIYPKYWETMKGL